MSKPPLRAFHGNRRIKDKYIKRVTRHMKLDQIVSGTYWAKQYDGQFKGCAVGCTIHSSDHYQYEVQLGIPKWLALIEDNIFESVTPDYRQTWPRRFLLSIKTGAILDNMRLPLIKFLLGQVESTIGKELTGAIFDSFMARDGGNRSSPYWLYGDYVNIEAENIMSRLRAWWRELGERPQPDDPESLIYVIKAGTRMPWDQIAEGILGVLKKAR